MARISLSVNKWFTLILTGLVFCMMLVSCARNPVTGKRQLVFISEKREIEMGREYDPQIVAQFGLYEDPSLQKFIDEKGQEMAAISHRSNLKYEFKILDSPIINAFAVPGGYVYFTRGIMAHFNNEAEFAGVLGHEIGHIAARHTVIQQRNMILSQIGLIAGIVLVPELVQFAQPLSAGVQILMLSFGREAERQSDKLGVEYSSKVGYNAKYMGSFFNTLERQQEKSGVGPIPEFLSTHPSPAGRRDAVTEMAKQWQDKLALEDPKVLRENYLRMVDGLMYGDDPKQGYLEDGIFYHPVMRFLFPVPREWSYQNSPQQVQMAPKDGKAALLLSLARGNTLQEAANNALQDYKLDMIQSNPVTVNGLNALAVTAEQKQEQQTLRVLMYIIQHGSYIFNMTGVSTATDFATYETNFRNSMTGFRTLTDQSKINKKGEVVRVRSVASNGTLRQALQQMNVPASRFDEMSILNGMLLDESVTAGQLIKIVQQAP